MERAGGPPISVIVLASLSAACILLTIAAARESESDAPAVFGALALAFAFAAAFLARGRAQGGQVLFVAVLITAFWTTGLWVLWRTWRIAGGFYDHLFPTAANDRLWRVAFQLVSVPIMALVLQVLLIALLTWLNDVSNRRRFRAMQAREAKASDDAPPSA